MADGLVIALISAYLYACLFLYEKSFLNYYGFPSTMVEISATMIFNRIDFLLIVLALSIICYDTQQLAHIYIGASKAFVAFLMLAFPILMLTILSDTTIISPWLISLILIMLIPSLYFIVVPKSLKYLYIISKQIKDLLSRMCNLLPWHFSFTTDMVSEKYTNDFSLQISNNDQTWRPLIWHLFHKANDRWMFIIATAVSSLFLAYLSGHTDAKFQTKYIQIANEENTYAIRIYSEKVLAVKVNDANIITNTLVIPLSENVLFMANEGGTLKLK